MRKIINLKKNLPQHTKIQKCNIEKQNIRNISGKDTALNGSTDSDSLVRVDTLAWVMAKDGFDSVRNTWHMSYTTNQDDFVDLIGLHTSIRELFCKVRQYAE